MYSQNLEEQYILEAVAGKIGTVLDIGAYDGKTRSNSLALVERGWSAVLVEPSPNPFLNMLALHGGNPNVKCVNALVGLQTRVAEIRLSDDGLSTTEQKNIGIWEAVANFRPASYSMQVTIDDLFAAFPILGHVDVVSIDTEGTSEDIFIGFPFHLCGEPSVFCVEIEGGRRQDLEQFAAKSRGYSVIYESGENVVFKKG